MILMSHRRAKINLSLYERPLRVTDVIEVSTNARLLKRRNIIEQHSHNHAIVHGWPDELRI